MSHNQPAAEFGSADEEIRRVIGAFAQAWAAAPAASEPMLVATEVVARHRRGARQLTDGAVLTLVTNGLIVLSVEAVADPSALAGYSGAIRLVNRYRAIVEESGGPQPFESLVPVAMDALDEERPDPQTFEALVAPGLLRRWSATLG
jgi:hypothetical protein